MEAQLARVRGSYEERNLFQCVSLLRRKIAPSPAHAKARSTSPTRGEVRKRGIIYSTISLLTIEVTTQSDHTLSAVSTISITT